MQNEHSLTPEQIAFFETFGFLSFPGLMADKIDMITEEFEYTWQEKGGGHDGKGHDGKARSCLAQFIDQNKNLSALLDDPQILGIAKSLLGDDFNYMGSDGNYYVGDTAWHSDGWHDEIKHLKFAFYLDPVDQDNGALRVIPGSHHPGDTYAESLMKNCKDWGITGAEVPALSLNTQPGDLLCFNHNTKHAAFGGSNRRRMFTINLCQRYPENKISELREYIAGGARFWLDRAYGKTMMANADSERMIHLEQVMANDDHLAELSRQARKQSSEPARS